MPPSDEIKLDGAPHVALLARATLVPLRPRDQAEAAALPAKLQALHAAAAADEHMVLSPTHLMVKGDEIIGYLSIGGLPTVQAWFNSQHKHAADSVKMIEHAETIMREQGARVYAVACAPQSPFSIHMERLGFTKLGETVLWRKEL